MANTNQPGAGNSSSTASKQQLSAWDLPQPILESFHKKGLKQLYPWQAAALDCAASGNNLVYCAPTSGVHVISCSCLQVMCVYKFGATRSALSTHTSVHDRQQASEWWDSCLTCSSKVSAGAGIPLACS